MSDDKINIEDDKKLAKSWGAGSGAIKAPLFLPDEMDIYTNKLTYETFIFHGKVIDYTQLDHIVYNAQDYSMTVHHKDGRTQDLGIKVQWLLRPYIKHANEISIVRTQDKVSVDGVIIPLVHAQPDA